MKRKIWKWIFSIFIVVTLVSLSTLLVLLNDEEDNSNPTEPQNPTQPTEIYAEAYSFNVPDTIYILNNTKVKLENGYISTTPVVAISKLSYEIVVKSSGILGGIEFENNIISAKSLGEYSIKFKIPKSETTNFSKNLNIVVYEDATLSHVYQTNNTIFIGESKNFNEFFITKNNNFNIETDGKTTYSNNTINTISEGESEIKFIFTENYIKYIYNFKINIKEQPLYEIVLVGINNNTLDIDFSEEPIKQIEYLIVNREQGYVNQDVNAISSNESVVRILKYTEPYIKIEILSVGEATITITYIPDPTIQIELKIMVK